MPKTPTYEGVRVGDIIALPEGIWYVDSIRYQTGDQTAGMFQIEGTVPEYQTDSLVLRLRRTNIEEDKA